jgi:hypothetical protein
LSESKQLLFWKDGLQDEETPVSQALSMYDLTSQEISPVLKDIQREHYIVTLRGVIDGNKVLIIIRPANEQMVNGQFDSVHYVRYIIHVP